MREFYTDDDIDVLVELDDVFTDGVFIHTNVKNFSVSRMKKFYKVWDGIVERLRLEGWKHAYAIPPSSKEEKWEKMFGFKDTGIEVSCYKLMILEL